MNRLRMSDSDCQSHALSRARLFLDCSLSGV
uniref:Uncharacterized protein n=1 Tax=Anguilla anguilla TaxID=7936 RepID=A0A0E9QK68_ANGAN